MSGGRGEPLFFRHRPARRLRMSDPIRLELSSLPARHPVSGEDILYDYGRVAVYRLCVDPDSLPGDVTERAVAVEHTPVRGEQPISITAVVGWAGHLDRAFCARACVAKNEIDVTEGAAIVLAALIVSEFERGRVLHVSRIGTRGDYLVEVDWRKEPVLLEIRGVRADDTPNGSVTRSKVKEKRDQVRHGYVSVTAFRHTCSGMPLSVLCFTG